MKRKKYFLSILSLIAITMLFAGFSPPSYAENDPNKNFYEEVSQNMKEDGADQADIDKVIKKLKNGETLDSEKATSSESSSLLANSDDMQSNPEFFITDENPVAMQKFEDGSYRKLELVFESSPQAASLNQTSANGQSLYFNVRGSSPVAKANYNTSAFIDTHLGNSRITGVSGMNIITLFGIFTDQKLVITQANEVRSKQSPAQAHLEFKWIESSNASAQLNYLKVSIGDHINDRYGIKVSFTNGTGLYQ